MTIAGTVVLLGSLTVLVAPKMRGRSDRTPSAAPTATTAPAAAKELPPPVRIDSGANEYMRWVAGRSTLDTSAAYRAYAKTSAASYATLRRNKLDPITAFATSKLAEVRSARTVLYPFAGGDVAYVSEFFPEADTVVLVGLEPTGRIFDWQQWTPRQRTTFLSKLGQSVSASNSVGFFLTNSMRRDFADSTLNGVVHPIMLYLGWKGFQIVRLSRFDPANPRTDGPMSDMASGMRVLARDTVRDRETVFEYVSADLSDSALVRDSTMVSYLRQWEEPVVYLKAASYLMHYPYFSIVRGTLADEAQAVLQDDTGFPLAILRKRFGRVRAFGSYTKPIELFSGKYQRDLRAMYEQPGVTPLRFRMGYGAETNLQFATQRKP
jgi:hypothetical protein